MDENVGSYVKSIDSKVFGYFKTLTSKEENKRLNSSLNLLQSLFKNQEDENKNKAANYVLKRLIRGVGASTTASRAGFYATLSGLFDTVPLTNCSISRVLELAKLELQVGGSIADKEDAGAIIGQILVCIAVMHSKLFENIKPQEIASITEVLLSASRFKSYHNSLAYTAILQLLQKITAEDFEGSVWPLLKPAIAKPWNKQTLNTMHCWIVITEKFSEIVDGKVLKANLGCEILLHKRNFALFYRTFWESTYANLLMHPVFEHLGKYLTKCKNLLEFWLDQVDTDLCPATKIKEIITIKVITDIARHGESKNLKLSDLLTENIMKMMITSIKNTKKMKDEGLKLVYEEFFDTFHDCCKNFSDEQNVSIIRKFILHPSSLGIERYTSHRIIHQIIGNLGSNGIRDIFETYKNIFLNKIPKNESDSEEKWLNVERQTAAHMLQTLIGHKNVQTESDWRGEQLQFLMVCSLFYFNNRLDIVSKNEDCGVLDNTFSTQMRNIFYTSLQTKISKLNEERKILLKLVKLCNDILQKKNFTKYFRQQIDESILKAWNEMFREVNKRSKSNPNGKIKLVFDILLMYMGLELFREPETAQVGIYDLEKCLEKANGVKENSILKSHSNEEEPEWIEVVIDLFLHLLSQNASSLRNTVNTIFPHLCDNLSLTAVHQILSVLEMKDGHNPLDDEQDNTLDINKLNSGDSDEQVKDDYLAGDNDDDDEDEDDDDEEDEDLFEEEEENNVNDQLRNAVASALDSATLDPDKDSVNLSDLDEEEGRRLDEALSDAFRAIKSTKQSKNSKEYRIKTTTVMHFRIRVLDLIDICIQQKPTFLIAIEVLISLYNMIDYCADKDLRPLLNKIQKTLGKLLDLRHFSHNNEKNCDLTMNDVCKYFRMIMDKRPVSTIFEAHNKLKNKICLFFIANSEFLKNISRSEISISDLLKQYVAEFINSRNPSLNVTLLNDIFNTRWCGAWDLAQYLVQNGLVSKTRVYRRIQIIELLTKLYKSYEHIRTNSNLLKPFFKTVEPFIQNYVGKLSEHQHISPKEFETILNLLFDMNKCHNKTGIKCFLDVENLKKHIQDIRLKIKMNSTQCYVRICNAFNMKVIRGSTLEYGTLTVAEEINGVNENVHNCNEAKTTKIESIRKKRKLLEDNRKAKKLKKQKQLLPTPTIRFSYSLVEAEN